MTLPFPRARRFTESPQHVLDCRWLRERRSLWRLPCHEWDEAPSARRRVSRTARWEGGPFSAGRWTVHRFSWCSSQALRRGECDEALSGSFQPLIARSEALLHEHRNSW